MKWLGFTILALLLALLIIGCTQTGVEETSEEVPNTDNTMQETAELPSQSPTTTDSAYQGTILAGTKALVIDFTQEDYESALNSDKTILLYFYANWCPICKREVQEMYSAFNELDNENIIAFRVNYKDSDTDSNEEALARQYGISYQHTKVILKNSQQIKKSPDSWDKERYLAELQEVS